MIRIKARVIVNAVLLLFILFAIVLIFSYLFNDVAPLENLDLQANKSYRRTCVIETVNHILKYTRENTYPNGIPRLIHYVYKTHYIPSQYTSLVKQCMEVNDNVKFLFWSDSSVQSIVNYYFPLLRSVYKSYFKRSVPALKISDINRNFIMFKFGGIYMDLDTQCQKSFDVVMENSSCILSREIEIQTRILYNVEYLAMNSLMACVPNHDFFKLIINKLNKPDKRDIIHQTGPFMLTKELNYYIKLLNDSTNPTKALTLAKAVTFSPRAKPFLIPMCDKPLIGKWRIQGCKDLKMYVRNQNIIERQAVTVHLFLHLGYEASKWRIKKTDYICHKFPDMILIGF